MTTKQVVITTTTEEDDRMPRKNHQPPRRRTRRVLDGPSYDEPSYDALARRLVDAGLCSVLILDRHTHREPTTTTERNHR